MLVELLGEAEAVLVVADDVVCEGEDELVLLLAPDPEAVELAVALAVVPDAVGVRVNDALAVDDGDTVGVLDGEAEAV